MFVTHSRGLLFHSFSTHLAFSQVWLTFLGLSFLFSFFSDTPGLLSLPSVFTHLSWLTSWIANWLEAHSLCSFGWAFWKPLTNNMPEPILLPNLRSLSSMFTLDSKPIANPMYPVALGFHFLKSILNGNGFSNFLKRLFMCENLSTITLSNCKARPRWLFVMTHRTVMGITPWLFKRKGNPPNKQTAP